MSDDEWAFVAPYLTLLDEDALQRRYPSREVFNAVRWMVTGDHVELAWVDERDTGEAAATAVAQQGIELVVVKRPEAKRGFVLLSAAGSPSAVSPGRPAFGGWLATRSGCLRSWRDSTSSPSPVSCSIR